ncbi:MAG TPA: hypothetical protein VK730_04645 [Solirubrobacteraceae bacterium]|jgi:hypothetical protein|nr:hypothetical protein [Solirubrobacteraceae bacterium]
MKPVRFALAGAAILLLSLAVIACGGAGRGASSTSSSATSAAAAVQAAAATTNSTSTGETAGPPREDRDKDYGDNSSDSYFDADDYNTVNYPHAADAADTQAVTTLVKRYLTAAAAEDGATGCSLIYSLFAETIPETLGLPPTGTPSLYGTTCAVVMTKLYKQEHHKLAVEAATLQAAAVRVNHMRGFALLHFKGIPAQSIDVHLERGVWKIDETVAIEVS